MLLSEARKKSRTVSFRVPDHIISEIERDAKTNLTSTNVLINQILIHYVSWDRYRKRAKMYPIPEEILIHVFDSMDDSEMKIIIDNTFNAIRDHALLSKKKFDIHSCLEVIEEYCKVCGIAVDDVVIHGRRSYTIHHDLGKNFSMFVKEYIEKIFWDLLKMKVEIQLTKTTVVATLQSPFD